MGIVIAAVSLVGFAIGSFWSAGLTFTFLNDRETPIYYSIPTAAVLGLIGGFACGAIFGFVIAYNSLPFE